MRFTSFTAVVVTLLALGSTSVLAHGTHAKSAEPSLSQDSAALLRRYFEENGYTARDIMDEYKLFRRARTKRKGSSLASLVTTVTKGAIKHSDEVVKLAGVVPIIRGSGGGSPVSPTGDTPVFADDYSTSPSQL